MPPGVLHPGPQHKKDVDLLEQVQRRVTKNIQRVEQRQAEKAEVIQPGVEKALGRPYYDFPVP